jgi:hypothetical protein
MLGQDEPFLEEKQTALVGFEKWQHEQPPQQRMAGTNLVPAIQCASYVLLEAMQNLHI